MSVTTEGIKGYEYQYKVTVLIALKTKAEKIKLYVEKKDGEDFFLEIESESSKLNIGFKVSKVLNFKPQLLIFNF